MSQADIGVNVFLIDGFTSPMGLVESAMGMLSMSLISGMSAAGGMSDQLGVLAAKMSEQEAKMLELKAAATDMGDAYALGQISLKDYGTFTTQNTAEQEALAVQMENTAADSAILESQLGTLTDSMTLMGYTMGAGIDFLAFAAGLKQADQAAADLTDTINQMSIAGNLTGTQLDALKGYLMQVANTSIYTADQVGQGFSLLEEKGYGASQIMKGIGQDAINLSMAIGDSSSGTTGATNLLATAMEVFKAKASDATHYANLLTFAYYNGIPSVDGLRSALEQVGGRAQMLKIPFDQIVASLDSLGRAGMTGQQAGQSLNYALQALYAPITKTQNELELLGIITANKVTPAFQALYNQMQAAGAKAPKFDGTVSSLDEIFKAGQKIGTIPLYDTFYQWALGIGMINDQFYNSNGTAKSFVDSLHILYQHLKTLNPEQLAAAMQQLFNVRSGQGISQLMNGLGQLDATYQKLKNSQDAQGLAQQDATKRTDSQNAKAKELTTTWTDFMAQTGQPLQDMFKNALGGLNTFIGGLTTGSPAVHQFFTAFLSIGAVLAGLGLLVGIIMLIGAFASGIIVPILAVAGGIVAVAALAAGAWMFIQSHMKQVQAAIAPLIQAFQSLLHMLNFQATLHDLQGAWNQLVTAIQPFVPMLKIIGMVIIGVIVVAIAGLIAGVLVAAKVLSVIFVAAMYVVTGGLHVLAGVLDFFKAAFLLVWDLFTGNTKAASAEFQNAVHAMQNILGGFNAMLLGIPSMIGAVFSHIGSAFQSFIQGAEQWGANLIQMFINGIMGKIGSLLSALGNVGNSIKNMLGFHSPTKEGPGSDADTWMPNMMQMFVHGIVSTTPALSAAAHGAALGVRGAFTSPSVLSAQGLNGTGTGAGTGSSGGTGVINFNVDGKTYTQIAVQGLTQQLVASGIQRTLR